MESDESEIGLGSLVSRRQVATLDPPVPSPAILPFSQLSPPMFERVVAEVAWLLDRLGSIRIYGRSGQEQGGLDLVGRRDGSDHVYQVRRIKTLTPQGLRKAVVDFAGPPRPSTPTPAWKVRRFESRRFVLATAAFADDRAIDDELSMLRDEYVDDLELDLYDVGELSRALRERPGIVAGVFGIEWARAFCGAVPHLPVTTPLPPAYALLEDPTEADGRAEGLARARELAEDDPGAAAELFRAVAADLDGRFPIHAASVRSDQRDCLERAGQTRDAFALTVDFLLDRYETGMHFAEELTRAEAIATRLDESANHLVRALSAVEIWTEGTYDLMSVMAEVTKLDVGEHGRAAVILAIAEQLVTDELHRPGTEQFAQLAQQESLKLSPSLVRVRLECANADLAICHGTSVNAAFESLLRRASIGALPDELATLVFLRAARAFAFAGDILESSDHYRRAVVAASNGGLIGDVRNALRAISHLSFNFGLELDAGVQAMRAVQTMASARAASDRTLIGGAQDPRASAFAALLDDKLPDANRHVHRWVHLERLSGSLVGELEARRRYGDVFARSGVAGSAIRQYALSGEVRRAVEVAEAAQTDLSVDLTPGKRAPWEVAVHAAIAAERMDSLPDDQVDAAATNLVELVDQFLPILPVGPSPAKKSLAALAALGSRIPASASERLLPRLLSWLPRDEHQYLFSDEAMLGILRGIATSQTQFSDTACGALVTALEFEIAQAEQFLGRIEPPGDELQGRVAALADNGRQDAVEVLVRWGIDSPSVAAAAVRASERFLGGSLARDEGPTGFGIGIGLDAELVRLASANDSNPTIDAKTRGRIVSFLAGWVEDTTDFGGRRAEAAMALARLLRDAPADEQTEVRARMLALHTDPGRNAEDEMELRSQHRLSRFRIDTGTRLLQLTILVPAAAACSTPSEALAVEELLFLHLGGPDIDVATARRAAAVIAYLPSLDSTTEAVLATNPSSDVRAAVAQKWGSDRRDMHLAESFAADPDRWVRSAIGQRLVTLTSGSDDFNLMIDALSGDPSALVRRTVHVSHDDVRGPAAP